MSWGGCPNCGSWGPSALKGEGGRKISLLLLVLEPSAQARMLSEHFLQAADLKHGASLLSTPQQGPQCAVFHSALSAIPISAESSRPVRVAHLLQSFAAACVW